MRVNAINDRQSHCPNYSFEFNCKDDLLDSMFWADETEKAYYAEFGVVISFDATFRTNKCRMVFAPFTAIDHHKKLVTVGAGFLSNGIIESYSWLLKVFLKTHGKEPTFVLTDQDGAIKHANENIPDDLFTNADFRKRFPQLVWDINMQPDVFEMKWGLLMKEFNRERTRWFKDMFTKHDSWIPQYFNDIPMCGLMKTTSMLESMSSFFNTYSESDWNVEIKAEEKEINCSCERFKCMGVLCKYAFTIIMRCGVKEIPKRYILKRLRKDVISRNYCFNSHQSDSGDHENVKLVNDSYYSFESSLDIVRNEKKKLSLFAEKQQMLLKKFESDYTSGGL
ncbi:protein FAR1-RELATED SEQUENCE 6-like [Lactuca sativa]|uniref:protein FAR1-RELATED SEQUENCE 6-like n=1 Tax=Lactuca sativa TaxID=4236 RepID=UPI000CD8D4CA|nr:protein FAR1-RELATED SEQUENCE 6-like [Lactuca sativa]